MEHGLTDDQQKEFERIAACHARLSKARVAVVSAATEPLMPKVVWKLKSYHQGCLYRSVALAGNALSLWREGEKLGAIILARSLIENRSFIRFSDPDGLLGYRLRQKHTIVRSTLGPSGFAQQLRSRVHWQNPITLEDQLDRSALHFVVHVDKDSF